MHTDRTRSKFKFFNHSESRQCANLQTELPHWIMYFGVTQHPIETFYDYSKTLMSFSRLETHVYWWRHISRFLKPVEYHSSIFSHTLAHGFFSGLSSRWSGNDLPENPARSIWVSILLLHHSCVLVFRWFPAHGLAGYIVGIGRVWDYKSGIAFKPHNCPANSGWKSVFPPTHRRGLQAYCGASGNHWLPNNTYGWHCKVYWTQIQTSWRRQSVYLTVRTGCTDSERAIDR